jgi:hypothetical protein
MMVSFDWTVEVTCPIYCVLIGFIHVYISLPPGIPKVLLLLTDGYSNGIKPLQPADQLRDLGVSIFSIGVGPSVSQSELKEIASDPDSDYVFTLSSFNQLASFVDRVSSVSCSGKFHKNIPY